MLDGGEMVLIGDRPCGLRKGNLLHQMNIGEEYMVKFQLYPYNFHPARSVIHFTAGERGNSKYGDRLPAISLKSKCSNS